MTVDSRHTIRLSTTISGRQSTVDGGFHVDCRLSGTGLIAITGRVAEVTLTYMNVHGALDEKFGLCIGDESIKGSFCPDTLIELPGEDHLPSGCRLFCLGLFTSPTPATGHHECEFVCLVLRTSKINPGKYGRVGTMTIRGEVGCNQFMDTAAEQTLYIV